MRKPMSLLVSDALCNVPEIYEVFRVYSCWQQAKTDTTDGYR